MLQRVLKPVESSLEYSSKTCSRCGADNDSRAKRKYECADCGLRADWGVNAALNLYHKVIEDAQSRASAANTE